MMQSAPAFAVGLILGIVLTLATIAATGGWYTYEMLDPGFCAMFKQGSFDVSPGRIVPNQPSVCYIQTPRFSLP